MNHAVPDRNKQRSYSGDYMHIGRCGEEVVMPWLKEQPQVCEIIDFRQIREVHECDVDCGLRLYAGNICLVEIKTDTYLGVTSNIIVEVLRINHTCQTDKAGYLGWVFRSPAKYLLYYAPNRKPPAIYKTTFDAVRRTIQAWTRLNEPRWQTTRTDRNKTTYNMLIPEAVFNGVFTICELPNSQLAMPINSEAQEPALTFDWPQEG